MLLEPLPCLEHSLVIVKPDALQHKVDDCVVQMFMEIGVIEKLERRTLLREEVERLYAHHADKDFFPKLIDHMVSGPSILIWVSGIRAAFRDRAIAIREQNPNLVQGPRNLVHATDYADDPNYERSIFGNF